MVIIQPSVNLKVFGLPIPAMAVNTSMQALLCFQVHAIMRSKTLFTLKLWN